MPADDSRSNPRLDEADEAVSAAAETIARIADHSRAALARAAEQIRDTYSRAADGARDVADTVDPFVHKRPYLALGLAAFAGLILGLLLARPGPKNIYVKPPAPAPAPRPR